jgi:hypothetical protein
MLDSEGNGEVSNIIDAATWLLQTSLDGITPNEDNRTNAEALGIDAINMSFGFNAGYQSAPANAVCGVFRALRADGVAAAAAAGRDEPEKPDSCLFLHLAVAQSTS